MTAPGQPPGPYAPGPAAPTGVVELRYQMCRPGRVVPRTWINGQEIPRSATAVQQYPVPAGPVHVTCRDTLFGRTLRVYFVLAAGQVVPVFYVEPRFTRNLPGKLTLDPWEVPPPVPRKLLLLGIGASMVFSLLALGLRQLMQHLLNF